MSWPSNRRTYSNIARRCVFLPDRDWSDLVESVSSSAIPCPFRHVQQRTLREDYLSGSIRRSEVATALEHDADTTLDLVAEVREQAEAADKKLDCALDDYEAQAWLGRYFAAMTRGAIDLSGFNAIGNVAAQASALKHFESAFAHWKQDAAINDRLYVPPLLHRVGIVYIPALTAKAAEDVEIVRIWKPNSVKGDGNRSGSGSNVHKKRDTNGESYKTDCHSRHRAADHAAVSLWIASKRWINRWTLAFDRWRRRPKSLRLLLLAARREKRQVEPSRY